MQLPAELSKSHSWCELLNSIKECKQHTQLPSLPVFMEMQRPAASSQPCSGPHTPSPGTAPVLSSSSGWLGFRAMTCTVMELREMVQPSPGGHTLWVCMCFFTLDFWAKARPHTMHWKGFSPV